ASTCRAFRPFSQESASRPRRWSAWWGREGSGRPTPSRRSHAHPKESGTAYAPADAATTSPDKPNSTKKARAVDWRPEHMKGLLPGASRPFDSSVVRTPTEFEEAMK